MASLYELFVKISGDNSGFKKSLKDSQTDLATFEAASESTANRLVSIGGKLMGAIGFGALGAGALAAASKFEEANVQIQRSTGATGEKLKGLEESFSAVYKQTAASSEAVTVTLSLLSTRTQATGKDLENLTLQTIKLAKTQKEDVATIVPLVTRAFGDWSIATDKQGKMMDFLRVTSQQTGISVSRLAEQVVYAGAPLRSLGYNFEQAATLIGKFEKEGVNTELVLGGMKAALGKFQKEGITDTAKAWQDFVAGVKSGSITMAEVVKEVGVKRAPDLSRAIMEGRFEIDKMVDSAKKLASEAAPNVTTLHSKFTVLQHQLESLVSAHKDLIVILGMTYPAWSGMAIAGGSAIGTLITRLIGARGATAAVATLSNSTFALGGTFTAAGSTIAAAGVTATAGWIMLAGTLAGIAAIIAAIAAGGAATANFSGKYPADPKTHLPTGGTFSGFGFTPNMPVDPRPNAPKPAGAPDFAFTIPGTTPPAATPASTQPATLNLKTMAGAMSFESMNLINAEYTKTLKAVTEWYLGLKKVETVSSSIKNYVLDFSVVAAATGPVIAQGVDVAVKSFSQSLSPAIQASETLMHGLGLTSTRELRAQYDAAMHSTEAMILLGASEADVEASATATAEAHKKLAQRMGEWDNQTKAATKTGVDFGRQISTVLTDLSRSLADIVMGTKSFGSAFAEVGKAIVRIIIEDIITGAIGKLTKALSGVLSSMGGIGKAISGLFGGGASAAGGAASGAGGIASGAGGVASGAAGAASSLMGTIGAVSAAVGAVSSIIGNFQYAAMNKSLDLIEHNTRYSMMYLGERGDGGILTAIFKMSEQISWGPGVKAAEMARDILGDIRDKMGSGLGGKGGISFTNCSFTGSPNAIADAIFTQAALAGYHG